MILDYRILVWSALTFGATQSLGGQAPGAQSAASPVAIAWSATLTREDLAQFRAEFLAIDRSYSPSARASAEARTAALEAAADTVSRAWFEFEIARIVALADNGHTNVAGVFRAERYNRVAVRLVPFADDFYVLRVRAPHADLLGARLISVAGRPLSDLRPIWRSFAGGTDAWRDRTAPSLLESPGQLRQLGIGSNSDSATYVFELSDGRRVARSIAADSAGTPQARGSVSRWMFPDPRVTEGDGWLPLLAADRTPWTLQDAATPFRWRQAPELDAIVVELRQNVGTQTNPIDAFLAEVESRIAEHKPKNLVLDMRQNGGGNLNTTRSFAERLHTLVPGRVYALTSPATFSAAISTVAYLKQASPERVSIVGEMVGDRLEFWAEGRPITLKNSGTFISRATQRHDYANGCRAYTDCHGSVVRFPISVGSLAPDIAAPWTISAYRQGRDPAIDAIAIAQRAPSRP